MMLYLLKMIACSAIFYGLYHFFLSKEKMFVFNRFYLLGGLLASYFIPLITITTIVDAPRLNSYIGYIPAETLSTGITETSFQDYLILIAYCILVMISALLLVRFITNLFVIRQRIKESRQIDFKGTKLALSKNTTAPYSFLNTIFLCEEEYENGKIEPEVLTHELAHVDQKHSLDILVVEVLQIISWFNPILYLYKNAIKMNHELLADAAVLDKFNDVRNYQHILLQRATSQTFNLALSSRFNYFTTKKRLTMLRKPFSKRRVLLASLALVPTLALALFAGCNQTEKQRDADVGNEKSSSVSINGDSIPRPPVPQNPKVSPIPPPPPRVDAVKIPPPPPIEPRKNSKQPTVVVEKFGPGASDAEFKEYTDEVKSGQKVPYHSSGMSDDRLAKLNEIYLKMNRKQRAATSQIVLLPPPPPKVTTEKFGPGATQSEMKEYEAIIKKGKTEKDGVTSYSIDLDQSAKIYKIYTKMNKQQKASSTQLPAPPPPMKAKE
ncbi:hypothetical protein ACVWYG_002918 [Pedobacter sp. UYEF25]